MPAAKTILSRAVGQVVVGLCLLAAPAYAQDGGDARLLFTGDVLLSRQVRLEIERTGRFPWDGFAGLFHGATWVAGNLEGAVGKPEDCFPVESASPCFDIPAALVPLLSKAGFHAMGMANNHAADLGAAGIEATGDALRAQGIDALSYRASPLFVALGGHSVAVIALSAVPGRDGARVEIPSLALRQKLRLARNTAELVVVFVHWGSELLDWPNLDQRRAAEWLVQNGADLIVGHHPHVVQTPQCVLGKPVFYSLGNHVFDQKYPATKEGLIADCRIRGNTLSCGGISTVTPVGSAFPQIAPDGPDLAEGLEACPVTLRASTMVNGVSLRMLEAPNGYVIEGTPEGVRPWRSQVLPLVSAEVGKVAGDAGPDLLFTLEQHYSSIDHEDGVRPYVYEVRAAGLLARWRGSALAWPLLDATLLPGGDGVLCALHRRDSFLELRPGSAGVRIAAYRWQGFGFAGVDDAGVLERCQAVLGVVP